jgi:hypothetical protein
MRKTEKRTREITETVETEVACDLCGVARRRETCWEHAAPYNVSETTIVLEAGTRYPGSGEITRTTFDVCPTCFLDRLMPWLASQGATPHVKRVDY